MSACVCVCVCEREREVVGPVGQHIVQNNAVVWVQETEGVRMGGIPSLLFTREEVVVGRLVCLREEGMRVNVLGSFEWQSGRGTQYKLGAVWCGVVSGIKMYETVTRPSF